MKTRFTITILALIAFAPVQAEEANPVDQKIELKNKSAFAVEGSGRNPFWPIGWKPLAKITNTQHVAGDVQASSFVVSSIAFDTSGRFAIINGKIMQAGQQFGLQVGNQTYQILVKSIEDGRVILGRRDEEIIVPLRRK